MTDSEAKAYDDFIADNKLVERTQLSKDTLRKIVKKAMIANNFAFIFADVVDSFIIDCNRCLSKFDKSFSHESKKNFNEMMKHLIAAKKCSEKLCKPMYQSACINSMCDDSDWWLSFIKLVDDRTATNSQRKQLLLEFLLNMPDGDSPYKVTFNDFKK